MKVPFQLRKTATTAPVTGLLLPTTDAAELLRLVCALGTEALPPVYRLAGGFLVKCEGAAWPGAVRLRSLATDLFLPADAELTPTLLDEEATGLIRGRGLVFLPGGELLGYDPRTPLSASDLLYVPPVRREKWRALPDRPPRAESLRSIWLEAPEPPVDDILLPGGSGVGEEEPRPADAPGPISRAANRATAGLGKALVWLGGKLGWKGLAGLGAGMVASALARMPRLSEDLLGRQEAALRELLRQFQEGDLDKALRRALPLGEEGSRGGAASMNATLPMHNIRYFLGNLLGGAGGVGSVWFGGGDVQAKLAVEYRKAAEAALARGDYRRAAFIYGKLLREYRNAADALRRGGLFHDAAILYLEKVNDKLAAASAFEAAGEIDRALELYRGLGQHVLAGDLLQRAGDDEGALAEYRIAADEMVASRKDHVGAAKLLIDKAKRRDLAGEYLRAGWKARPQGNPAACLLNLLDLTADEAAPQPLLELIDEGEVYYAPERGWAGAGDFYNAVARIADRPHHEVRRDDLRDRALRGLAGMLRQSAGDGAPTAGTVNTLLGKAGVWPAAVIADADHAARRARPHLRQSAPAVVRRSVSWVRVGEGTVTAFHGASASGAVFLGFEDGMVGVFRPQAHTARPLQPELPDNGPVLGLATDSHGQTLAVLREHGAAWGGLSCHVESAGVFTREGLRVVQLGAGCWIEHYTDHTSLPFLGLWDGGKLTRLNLPELSPSPYEMPPLHGEGDVTHAARVRVGGDWWRWLLVRGSTIELPSRTGKQAVLPIGWRPGLGGSDAALSRAPLCWVTDAGEAVLVGVDDEGVARWTELRLTGDDAAVVVNAAHTLDKYVAATAVGVNKLAAVSRTGVTWLTCTGKRLHAWAATSHSFATAIACHYSPPTNELLVICRDGFLARMPVPR